MKWGLKSKRKHRYNWKSTIIDYFKKASELYEAESWKIDRSYLNYSASTTPQERQKFLIKSQKLKEQSADFETIATRITQSGIPIYRDGYGVQKWEFKNRFNPDYAKKYNWQRTKELQKKFNPLIDTHKFYLLTVCLKQINENDLEQATEKLQKLWQTLKYKLAKNFDGAYGMIEFDYGFTTIDGETKTTYNPHAHYWLTVPKQNEINTGEIENKIRSILEKNTGSVKTGVELHQHYNAFEKAGYVHKWLFIGNDYGNENDTAKTENEIIQNALILATIYKASKHLRPMYFGILSNREHRIINNKIKEKSINKELAEIKNKNDTSVIHSYYTFPSSFFSDNTLETKTIKIITLIKLTPENATVTLITDYFCLVLISRRIKEKPK